MFGKRFYLFLLFLFFVQFAQGQLSNFTLNVSVTNESCTANGALNFSVSNTTAGATMIYTIYHLPNTTTPISVQNTTSFGGLVAGDYRVVATQSLGSQSGVQQQDVSISSSVTILTYQIAVQNVRCGNDGKITVNVMSGPGPYHYEIFQGPAIYPLQTSNVFSGLAIGQYSLRVFDNCGEGVVQTFTIGEDSTGLTFSNHMYDVLSCNTIRVHDQVQPTQPVGGVIVYPLTIQCVVNPPVGSPIVLPSQTINSGFTFGAPFTEVIPYYYNQPNTVTITVTDGCNNSYQTTYSVNIHLVMQLEMVGSCTASDILIKPEDVVLPYTVSFLEAPAGFNPSLGNPQHPGPFSINALYNVNNNYGNYTIQITDACGRTAQQTVQISPGPIAQTPAIYSSPGCEEGYGGVNIYPFIPIANVTVTNAPPEFGLPLPYITPAGFVNSNGNFFMGPLPAGNYIFEVTDTCNNIYQLPIEVIGYHELANNITIIPNCGSFDINLQHSSNLGGSGSSFWLQKYDPITQQWVHPDTGLPFTNNVPGNNTAIPLINNAINYNFAYTGTFRIIQSFTTFGNGVPDFCLKVLKEFTYDGLPKINRVYSFSCNNGTYDVIVDATGVPPLLYRIVEKDGQPYVVQNGNSYIFLGIPAAHYKFQVEDPCGNILNSEFDVPSPFGFGITASNLCDGMIGSLTVPNFSILQYTWWQGNNTATVLSTTNALDFPFFNTANDAGMYHVRVQYTGNPNSCLDFVLDYNVTGNGNPNAGLDNSVSYCGNPPPIDLNTLLTGNFQTTGTWNEVTNSGALLGNVWNAATVPYGFYRFSYTVNGSCNTSDFSIINIEIKETPQGLTASANPVICQGNDINLTASTIANATYSWTGPNAFTSTEQNPIITNAAVINSGIYNVVAAIGSCVSASVPVNVTVNATPNFTLDAKCEGGRYTITVIPVNSSFDTSLVSYSWTGPDNYTGITNPADITQLATGDYSVTVTDVNGCSDVGSINITQTICFIPNVITPNNDDTNDSFDLTGFGVDKLEIYNRWGRKVYEKSNYLNEWHGQNMHGGQLPDSTYYYIIKLSTEEVKNGWVFLNKG